MSDVEKRRFVRVYYDDLERDYGEPCWFDQSSLSTYVRLLAGCDKAWPSMPELPRTVRRSDLAKLTTAGLVVLGQNGHYTVKGYAKERGARETAARNAAKTRWNGAGGHADA